VVAVPLVVAVDDADGNTRNAELLGQVANGLVDLPVDAADGTSLRRVLAPSDARRRPRTE
jgi:hypothetical protein